MTVEMSLHVHSISFTSAAPVASHARLTQPCKQDMNGCRHALLTPRLLFQLQARRIVVYDMGLSTPQVGRRHSALADPV